MLWARVFVAVGGIPILLLVAYLGSVWLLGVVAIISFLGLREYHHLLRRLGLKPPVLIGYLGTLGILLAVYWQREFSTYLPFLLLWVFLGGFLLRFPRYSLADIGATFLGCLYIPGSLAHLFLLRAGQSGSFGLLLYTFLLTWVSDTAAYFIGRGLGSRKLCPVLSPGKTWEGAWGAGVVTVAVGVLLGIYLFSLGGWRALVLSFLITLAAQVGDLIESGMKRLAQVKDSSHLLPGHGGILDRFDSLFLVAPVVYYFWKWLA
ncbi:phosphatidate cytidylyltransferase [Thermanaeromonas toyohensis ToBE]|uniref:Phosphatidate cytidylyltransferase n=1 Tax=Thermanaeromonas toyohensis ToBE TaxID=698762 RepID=A0A1W1VQ78_9FIRM|nr:phosphatidate cytidylyltransferase [Thermanaeromonas toyohensis]SMB95508.1 phosphatidate cytidylyltransferase [Thermanaeromonas toyohensis ToBE]